MLIRVRSLAAAGAVVAGPYFAGRWQNASVQLWYSVLLFFPFEKEKCTRLDAVVCHPSASYDAVGRAGVIDEEQQAAERERLAQTRFAVAGKGRPVTQQAKVLPHPHLLHACKFR